MGRFCTGVTIVTAVDGGEPVGFTAQSFTSVSLEPPLISFCPGKSVGSWARIRSAGTFCVNILSEEQEALCRTFASKGQDKFRGVGWHPGPATGAPVLDGVIGWVEAQIVAEHEAGDHLIVVGRVIDLDSDGGQPLLFYRGGFGRFQP
ncbi:MAG: flavin reductase family protein [Actinobacteria bacterium]|nr:flavin reductase family protein [Actinomycetota bacterium]MBW3649183.1 flavin reductase family protein [Actinomycetota bacterium]